MSAEPVGTNAVADVYAGDSGGPYLAERTRTIFSYVVDIDPEPDALVRVAMVFNLANQAPLTFDFKWTEEDRATIAVTIPLVGDVQADLIRRKIEQLTCTNSVLLAQVA